MHAFCPHCYELLETPTRRITRITIIAMQRPEDYFQISYKFMYNADTPVRAVLPDSQYHDLALLCGSRAVIEDIYANILGYTTPFRAYKERFTGHALNYYFDPGDTKLTTYSSEFQAGIYQNFQNTDDSISRFPTTDYDIGLPPALENLQGTSQPWYQLQEIVRMLGLDIPL